MSYVLQYSPGQTVTIILETLFDSGSIDGYRSDGYNVGFGPPDGYGADGYYSLPIVARIILPSLTNVSGYPQKMIRIDTGLYYFQFTLPTGASAVGSYIVDITYINPNTENFAQTFYQVICSAPFGMYSVTTF
jgi:hypothetical protein